VVEHPWACLWGQYSAGGKEEMPGLGGDGSSSDWRASGSTARMPLRLIGLL